MNDKIRKRTDGMLKRPNWTPSMLRGKVLGSRQADKTRKVARRCHLCGAGLTQEMDVAKHIELEHGEQFRRKFK